MCVWEGRRKELVTVMISQMDTSPNTLITTNIDDKEDSHLLILFGSSSLLCLPSSGRRRSLQSVLKLNITFNFDFNPASFKKFYL